MIKILKNTTLSDIIRAGHVIPAEGQWQVPYEKWMKVLEDSDLISDIESGDIVVSDDNDDLAVKDGLAYLALIDDSLYGRNQIKQKQVIIIPEAYQQIIADSLKIDGEVNINGTLSIYGAYNPSEISHNDLANIGSDDHHNELHTVASHSDTTATGSQLNALVGGSETTLHSHPSNVIFGQEYTNVSDESQSSTTSTSFQEKLSMTTGNLVDGAKYLISWCYRWRASSTTQDFLAQVQLNNTTTVMSHRQEPKDAGANQVYVNSGFYEYTASGTGSLSIDLDYCSSNVAVTAYISEARMSFWRVE